MLYYAFVGLCVVRESLLCSSCEVLDLVNDIGV